MSTYKQILGLFSVGLFGIGAYFNYQINEAQKFKNETFAKLPNKKQYLFQIHQNKAYSYDKILDSYEKYTKLDSYRRILLSYAKGDVLETGVGTSRNINYYPAETNVVGVDWSPNVLEVAMMKPSSSINFRYKIEDVEQMSFSDNTFDTVVDTFGLEYYLNPQKVIQEMKRVCKKDGQILILTSGLGSYDYMNLLLELKFPFHLSERGYFVNRDWAKYISDQQFTIEREERKMNGTIYFYVLRNNKKE